MPFELIVALRYLREGRTQTALILAGIAVGVGVIVFLSALIGGLQRNLIATTLGTQPHIVVRPREDVPRVLQPPDGRVREARVERPAQRVRSIVQWQQARSTIADLPGVVATSPTISGAAIAVRGGGANAVAVRGIEPESYRLIVPLDSLLVTGRVDLDGLKVLIGVDLARELGVEVGGRVRLRVGAEDRRGADTASALAAYTVSGIFDFGSADLNERWVFASLRTTQSLFALEGGASSIEVRLREIYAADRIAADVVRRTGLVADSWMTTNAQLLSTYGSASYLHWTICTSPPDATRTILSRLPIDYILLYEAEMPCPFVQLDEGLRLAGAFGEPPSRVFLLRPRASGGAEER